MILSGLASGESQGSRGLACTIYYVPMIKAPGNLATQIYAHIILHPQAIPFMYQDLGVYTLAQQLASQGVAHIQDPLVEYMMLQLQI